MAKDEKKPSTIVGLTSDEMHASRVAWVNGEYTLERGFPEWLATYRQAKIAEKQIEAARMQIEAADKLFELERLKQQATAPVPAALKSEPLEPDWVARVHTEYPNGVPRGHAAKALALTGLNVSLSHFRKLLRQHGL